MIKPHIAIVGAGPIGGIMAAYLARQGHRISIVETKEELVRAIQDQGITVKDGEKTFTASVEHVLTRVTELGSLDIDLYFIAVKFNYMDALLDDIKPIFKPGQKIIVAQNGIDNEDRVAEKMDKSDVLRFVVNYAGMLEQPGIAKMSFFNPPNYIGIIDPQNEALARDIAQLLTEAGLESKFAPDIKKYEWKKTILNASLMPVCATTGLTMKEAMTQEHTRWLCEQILSESIQVAARLGFTYGDDFFDTCIRYLSNAGHHKPSTSLDLEAGNPVEYIFQPIIDYSKTVGSPAPVLESLTRVMRTLEKKKRQT